MNETNKIIEEIKSGIYYPFYLLMGNEPYFISQISTLLENTVVDDNSKSFDLSIFYGKETTIEQVLETAKRFPMISNKQLVIVRQAQYMDGNLDLLIPYLNNPQLNTILVICYNNKRLDKRKKIYKLISEIGVIVDTKPLYDNQTFDWIKTKSRGLNISINQKAILVLISFLGNNIGMINTELEKLRISVDLNTEITPELIEKHIGYSKDYNVFELQNSLGKRNLQHSYRIIKYMSSNKNKHPLVLTITLLFNFFQKILMYQGLKNKANAVKILGVSSYFIKDYESISKNFSMKQVAKIISYIKDSDFKSKGVNSNDANPEDILKELIFKIVTV